MNSFRPVPGGWECSIGEVERDLFLKAICEVRALLDPPVLPFEITNVLGDSEEDLANTDVHLENASLDRLLPPGSVDKKTAQTMRELTDSQLRTEKSERLDRLYRLLSSQTGPMIVIQAGQEWDWLGGTNDVRLAISGKLNPEVNSEGSPKFSPESVQVAPKTRDEKFEEVLVSSFYDWLSGWQDSLLQAIDCWPCPS